MDDGVKWVDGVPRSVPHWGSPKKSRICPSPASARPVQDGEGAPPSDLISCLQPGGMVSPSPIVQYFLILLVPSDSPSMKSQLRKLQRDLGKPLTHTA